MEELPFASVEPLPVVSRPRQEQRSKETFNQKEGSYKNHAPIQVDERAKELLKEALKMPINITAKDLLNVSEPVQQALKRFLTKKCLEKKSVAYVAEEPVDKREDTTILVEKLPKVSYKVLTEETKGMPKGAVVIGDPIIQYLSTLQPGEKPKKVVVAKESQGLRAVYPLINRVGEVESLLDSGSQIISMTKDVAMSLEIVWDPDIVVHMQSAN